MVRSGGGFYKRGCQVKTLFPGRRARGFLGIQPCMWRGEDVCGARTLDGWNPVAAQWRAVGEDGGRLCWRATRQGIANGKLIERRWAEAGSGSLRPRFFFLSIDFPMPPKTRMS